MTTATGRRKTECLPLARLLLDLVQLLLRRTLHLRCLVSNNSSAGASIRGQQHSYTRPSVAIQLQAEAALDEITAPATATTSTRTAAAATTTTEARELWISPAGIVVAP